MATFQNETFSNEKIVVDGNRYVTCTFVDCALIYNGGELPVFDRCDLQGMSLQLGGAALSTMRYLSALHQAGFTKPVDAVLNRVETTATKSVRQQKRFYDPQYTGTNWGQLLRYGLVMFAVTIALLAALHYGLQVFPRNQVLAGDTVRPLTTQLTYDLMPLLPDELSESYDALRQSQIDEVTTYGWIDEEAQIARIPVDTAMDLLLEDGGLPAAEGS